MAAARSQPHREGSLRALERMTSTRGGRSDSCDPAPEMEPPGELCSFKFKGANLFCFCRIFFLGGVEGEVIILRILKFLNSHFGSG